MSFVPYWVGPFLQMVATKAGVWVAIAFLLLLLFLGAVAFIGKKGMDILERLVEARNQQQSKLVDEMREARVQMDMRMSDDRSRCDKELAKRDESIMAIVLAQEAMQNTQAEMLDQIKRQREENVVAFARVDVDHKAMGNQLSNIQGGMPR